MGARRETKKKTFPLMEPGTPSPHQVMKANRGISFTVSRTRQKRAFGKNKCYSYSYFFIFFIFSFFFFLFSFYLFLSFLFFSFLFFSFLFFSFLFFSCFLSPWNHQDNQGNHPSHFQPQPTKKKKEKNQRMRKERRGPFERERKDTLYLF